MFCLFHFELPYIQVTIVGQYIQHDVYFPNLTRNLCGCINYVMF